MHDDEHLDGKFLISSTEAICAPRISPSTTWKRWFALAPARQVSMAIDRPEAHPRPAPDLPPPEDRIRTHALLSFLALLLCRVAETRARDTWRNLHASWSAFTSAIHGTTGRPHQRTAPPPPAQIHTALDVPKPPRFLAIEPTNNRAGNYASKRPTGVSQQICRFQDLAHLGRSCG